jgi:hypothetical protein
MPNVNPHKKEPHRVRGVPNWENRGKGAKVTRTKLDSGTINTIIENANKQKTPPPPPPAPLLESIVHGVNFKVEDPHGVSGWVNLGLFPNGAINFSGHAHNSGMPTYTIRIVWVVRSSSGAAYVFLKEGKVYGWEPGSRDWDFNDTPAINQAIVADWPALSAGHEQKCEVDCNLSFSEIFDKIKGAIGPIKEVITVIGSL